MSTVTSAVGSQSIAVLSPHSDDAALSLAGFLHLSAAEGCDITIITVFSRSRRTRTGGVEDDEERVTAMRKAEDHAFLASLSASATGVWCDLPDPSVRLSDEPEYWYVPVPLSPREREFIELTADSCRRHVSRFSALLAPAGLGKNRDHLIVHEAGVRFTRESGCRLLLYEDLPYAARMSERELERSIGDLAERSGLFLVPRLVADRAMPLHKRSALSFYPSQMNGDIVRRVVWHSLCAGGLVTGAERLWDVRFAGAAALEGRPASDAKPESQRSAV